MRPVDIKAVFAKNSIFVALILLIAFFAVMNPSFATVRNGVNILLQVADLGLVVMPLAMLLIAGVVDLSIGSIASCAAVVSALTMSNTGSLLLGILAGFGFGIIAGGINGFLVAYLGLNPIVVTLGFLSVWGGSAMLLTGGRTVTRGELPESFSSMTVWGIGPVPLRLILFILAVLLVGYLLNRHRIGREIYAIGGNERAAYLMGVKVARVRFGLFVLTGFMAALAGISLAVKVQSVSPAIGVNMEMNALTVVLLGGVAFAGGSGRVSGVVAGLLFYGVLRSGLVFLQASPFVQTVVVGLTLVIAIALDESIQRVVKKSWQDRGQTALREQKDALHAAGNGDVLRSSEAVAQQRKGD